MKTRFKHILASDDIMLSFPNLSNPFILQTDASGSAIGYVLDQKENVLIKLVKIWWKDTH